MDYLCPLCFDSLIPKKKRQNEMAQLVGKEQPQIGAMVLQCGHTLCSLCVDSLLLQGSFEVNACPFCLQISFAGFRLNYAFSSLFEKDQWERKKQKRGLREKGSGLGGLCGLCGEKEGTILCLQCKGRKGEYQQQCVPCSSLLHSFKKFRQHQLSFFSSSPSSAVTSHFSSLSLSPTSHSSSSSSPSSSLSFPSSESPEVILKRLVKSTKEEPQKTLPPLSLLAQQILSLHNKGSFALSFSLATQAALADGDVAALLSLNFNDGLGTPVDKREGVRWAGLAAETGSLFGKGIHNYLIKDDLVALEILLPYAVGGLSTAQRCVGFLWTMMRGQGISDKVIDDFSFEFDRRAAIQGDPSALNNLGVSYYKGTGTEKNREEAFSCYSFGASKQFPRANTCVAECLERGEGVHKDQKRPIVFFRRGADTGDLVSLYRFGVCLYEGDGVPRQKKLGIRYLTIAAEREYGPASLYLGYIYCYAFEFGGASNQIRGVGYLRVAASSGSANAFELLARCYRLGEGVTQNYEIAYQMALRAVEAGRGDKELGILLLEGKGVPKDLQRAKAHLSQAAEEGDEECFELLQTIPE